MRKLLLVSAALATLASSPASAADDACPQTAPADLAATLGAPVAWLAPGQTIHAPANLTVMGLPVAYVVVTHAGASDEGAVTEMDYRLKGANRPFGERYPVDLRKAFDKGFSGSNCASANSSCSVSMTGSSAGHLSDAELSEGDLSMPKDAHGDGLALIKADMDMDNADPVFLDCVYKASK
jgi:hypothetical protein